MGDADSTTHQRQQPRSKGLSNLMAHVSNHKIDVALWFTRLLTLVFALLYVVPILDVSAYVCYERVLISNAATSALRLHQRLPRVQLTRQFLSLLLLEDSCHYLFYSLIFLYTFPITLAILPVVCFAALHSASYTLVMLDEVGHNSWWGARLLISLVELQQRNILRLVAFTEIVLMPFMIFMIFTGKTSLVAPFIYYRFLSLRYSSRRNPFTRQVFSELRMVIEMQCNRPGCPAGLRAAVHKIIGFITRLAPVTTPPPS